MAQVKRILLIDDDVDDQVFFMDAVNELDGSLKCEIANNGKEAIARMKIMPLPDLIFLDLNMPVMSGYECMALLKKDGRYKDIPIIIFTTSRSVNDIEKSRQMGAKLYFTKPSNFNTLCSKLSVILQMDFTKMQFAI